MRKVETKKIELEYPGRRRRDGIKARAMAVARVTPTMYVVERSNVIVFETKGPCFGPYKLRFSRTTGAIVGGNYLARWRVVNP